MGSLPATVMPGILVLMLVPLKVYMSRVGTFHAWNEDCAFCREYIGELFVQDIGLHSWIAVCYALSVQ